MLDKEELLFDELYEKTKDCCRIQFVKLLMEKVRETKELKKQLEDLFSENRNLRKKLENCMTFEEYKDTLHKKVQLKAQQKEFIKWLEDKIKFSVKPTSRVLLKSILANYKEIIGGSDENN